MTRGEHLRLWRADPRATPFQHPAWLDAWWMHLGGGERIDAEARAPAGRLVAALSLFVWNDGGVRRLVPVGASQSDYLDALVDPAEPWAAAALRDAILTRSDRWDELLLDDVRADSPLLCSLPDGWRVIDEPCETCPVLALPPAPPLLAGLTKTQRRKVVHDRHRAAALGGVTVAFAAPDEIDAALTALFDLHAARWQLEGQEGVLAAPAVQAFHRAAAPALAEAGLLRLVVVRHEGRIVSVLLGFADAHRGYSYIIGSDFSVPKQSFGTLAFAHLIETCLEERARAFHFLRGEEAYKYQWGAVPTRTVRRRVTRT